MKQLAALLLLGVSASTACLSDADCCTGICSNERCLCTDPKWMGDGCCTVAVITEPSKVLSVNGARSYGISTAAVGNVNLMFTTAFDEVSNEPYVFLATGSQYFMRPNTAGNSDRPYVAIEDASDPVLLTRTDMAVTVPIQGSQSQCSSRISLATTEHLDQDIWLYPWNVSRLTPLIPSTQCTMSPSYVALNGSHFIAYSVSPHFSRPSPTTPQKVGIAVSNTSAAGPYTVIVEDIGVQGWQPKFGPNNNKLNILVHTEKGVVSSYSENGTTWTVSNNTVISLNTTGYSDRTILRIDSDGVFSSMLEEATDKYLVVHEDVAMSALLVGHEQYTVGDTAEVGGSELYATEEDGSRVKVLCDLNATTWFSTACFDPPVLPNETTTLVFESKKFQINTTIFARSDIGCQSHAFTAGLFSIESGASVELVDGTLQGNVSVDATSQLLLKSPLDWACARGVMDPLRNSTVQQSHGLMSCAQVPVGFSPRICGDSMQVAGNLTVTGHYTSIFSPLTLLKTANTEISDSAFLWGVTQNYGTLTTGALYWHTSLSNEEGGVINIGLHNRGSGSLHYARYVSGSYPEAAIINNGTVVIYGGMTAPPLGSFGGRLINLESGNLTIAEAYLESNWQIENYGHTDIVPGKWGQVTVVRGPFYSEGSVRVSGWASFSQYTCSECTIEVVTGSQLNFMASARPSNKLIEKMANPGEALTRLEVCTDGLCDQHACPYPIDSHAPCQTESGGFGVQAYNDVADRHCYPCEFGPSLDQRITSTAAKAITIPHGGSNDDDRTTVIQSFRRPSISFSNGHITGGGRVVCSVPVAIEGTAGLQLTDVSVFSTVEHGMEAASGYGPISVGKSAVLSIGIESVLTNSHVTVAEGGLFHIDSHSEVRASNFTLTVPKGANFRLDGALHLDDRSKFNVCGESSGVGTLHLTSTSARGIDQC